MREMARGYVAMLRLAFEADRRRALLVFVLSPLLGATNAVFAVGLRWITDAVIDGDRQRAMVVVAGVGVLIGAQLIAALGGFTVRLALRERVDLLVDQRLIQLTTSIPTLAHHEHPEYLDRLELLRTNRQQLGTVIEALAQNLQNLLNFAITTFLLASVHPALILLPLAGVPSMWITGTTQRRIDHVERETAEASRRALHLFDLGTAAGAGKELRIFRLGPELRRRHHGLWTERDAVRNRSAARAAWLRAVGWLVFALGYGAALLLVVREAGAGRSTPGEVLMALSLAAEANNQATNAAFAVQWLFNSSETISRFLWLVDYARDHQERIADPAAVPVRLTEGIALDAVTFTYPDADAPTLRDVNMSIPAGATVAIVGDNGAGKTTLVKLLTGMYQPDSGRITIDGVDLARIPIVEWRAHVAAGFQDFVRYDLIAREVVGIGDLPRADDQSAVEQALDRAGSPELATQLPDGLDTSVGSAFGGSELSGGQWQKLSLGRAMMRDAPLLLVLDEPTASLDADAEHALFERYAIAARSGGATVGAITVLMSHRFSTVRMADLIVVLDESTVAEVGSHDELMARRGLYAELFELQARAYR